MKFLILFVLSISPQSFNIFIEGYTSICLKEKDNDKLIHAAILCAVSFQINEDTHRMYSRMFKSVNDVEFTPNYLEIFIIRPLMNYFGGKHEKIQLIFDRQESIKIINTAAKKLLNDMVNEDKMSLESFVFFLSLQFYKELLPLLNVEEKREFVSEHTKRYKEYFILATQVKAQQTEQTDYKTAEHESKSRKSMPVKHKVDFKDKWSKIEKFEVIELFDYKKLLFFINEPIETRKKQNEKTNCEYLRVDKNTTILVYRVNLYLDLTPFYIILIEIIASYQFKNGDIRDELSELSNKNLDFFKSKLIKSAYALSSQDRASFYQLKQNVSFHIDIFEPFNKKDLLYHYLFISHPDMDENNRTLIKKTICAMQNEFVLAFEKYTLNNEIFDNLKNVAKELEINTNVMIYIIDSYLNLF